MVETLLDLIDSFSITLDVVKVGLNVGMNENDLVAKQSQNPTRHQGTRPQTNSSRLSQKLMTQSESIYK